MKKVIFLICIASIFMLCACKKDRDCECKTTKADGSVTTKIIEDAEKECDLYNEITQGDIYGENVNYKTICNEK